jgi:hypothetical protein
MADGGWRMANGEWRMAKVAKLYRKEIYSKGQRSQRAKKRAKSGLQEYSMGSICPKL